MFSLPLLSSRSVTGVPTSFGKEFSIETSKSQKRLKNVKVYLHNSFNLTNFKILISRDFDIFKKKVFHPKLVGTPCTITIRMQSFIQISQLVATFKYKSHLKLEYSKSRYVCPMVISMVFDLLRGGVQPFLRFHPFPTIHTAPLASKPWSALCCHCSFFVLIWLDILQAIKTPREATWDHHSHFVHCEVQKKVLKSFSIAAGQRAQNSLLVESCACDSGYCGFELYHRLSSSM